MATVTDNGNGNGCPAEEGGGGKINNCITSFVDQGSVESSRYYYSRRTVCERLLDRGYDVPDSDLTRSLAEFRRVYGEQPDVESLRICVSASLSALIPRARLKSDIPRVMVLILSDNFSMPYKVLVIFLGTVDVKVQTIRHIYSQIMDKGRLSRLMIIQQSKIIAYAQKELQKWPFKVEIFKINDLLFNITKHVLVPKYEILTTDEKQKLLEKYKLEAKQLPYMQETDAIARYYGLEKGQVVKITHSGGLSDSFINYRCVV